MKRLAVLFFSLILITCDREAELSFRVIEGETMGTYYRITYGTADNSVTKGDIDRQLTRLNLALSTYIEQSVISLFNQSESGLDGQAVEAEDLRNYFFDNVRIAYDLYQRSDGYYDPTVMPLVNYWGFGYDPRGRDSVRDSGEIRDLMDLVGLDKLKFESGDSMRLSKALPGMELDFSASAKGYAIDCLAAYLESEWNIQHYLIDIGGESKGRGVNAEGLPWRIGISNPEEGSGLAEFVFVISLENLSVATSGNYRNFYVNQGETISHTMNPRTGFYERNNLLSVSVLTDQCAFADGIATACMAMGYDRAVQMIESEPSLEALFIYLKEDGVIDHYITHGILDIVEKVN